MEGLWKLFNWIAKLAYLNILWITFTLLGFIVLGIGPATSAVFSVMKKLLDEEDFPMWRVFYDYYKHHFWIANKFMLIIVPVCCFIYLDFLFIQTLPYSFFIDHVVFTAIIILSMLMVILFSYLFATHTYFEVSYFKKIKYAALIAGINPLPTTLILLGLLIFVIILLIIPAISIFYLVSLPVCIIQLCAQQGLKKLHGTYSLW